MNEAPTWIYTQKDGQHRLSREVGETTQALYFEKTAKPRVEEITDGDQVFVEIRRFSIDEDDAKDHGTFYVFVGQRPAVEWADYEDHYLLRRVHTTNEESKFPTQHLTESAIGVSALAEPDVEPGDFCSVSIRKTN